VKVMSIYDAKICFVWSQMLVTDEIKSVAKMTTLTFVEFLEAIARAATCMFKCSAAEQQGTPLHCLHLYFTTQKAACAQQRANSSVQAEPKPIPSRPLSAKPPFVVCKESHYHSQFPISLAQAPAPYQRAC
jgi:hypothetical protein